MTLDEINALECAAFVDKVGWVFEHSPWVAERAWSERPFASIDDLHTRMVTTVTHASRERQLALIHAHPDLGALARVSDASACEQAGAGLRRLTHEEFDRLATLNADYKAKFGFPFLFAVKGSTVQHIFRALAARLPRSWDDEFAEALRQVARIARSRLDDLIART
jgi:2-oxo-4-hydroxy-4-carboxy-5-ureidoimidazoline decarboxylase